MPRLILIINKTTLLRCRDIGSVLLIDICIEFIHQFLEWYTTSCDKFRKTYSFLASGGSFFSIAGLAQRSPSMTDMRTLMSSVLTIEPLIIDVLECCEIVFNALIILR